jgi:hypothetical protein
LDGDTRQQLGALSSNLLLWRKSYATIHATMAKSTRQPHGEAEFQSAVWHVVYEYGNLISAGELLQKPLTPPINTHVQDAFLISVRKLADFFTVLPKEYDVVASDYTNSPQIYNLPTWNQWSKAIDRQLAHITWKRDQGWNGSANKPLMEELRAAWKLFLKNLDPKYKAEFEQNIAKRKGDKEYANLDLS